MPEALIDLVARLGTEASSRPSDRASVIAVIQPISANSDAIVRRTTADDRDVHDVDGYSTLIDVAAVRHVLDVWSLWRGGRTPSDTEAVEAVLYYARHHAFEPVDADSVPDALAGMASLPSVDYRIEPWIVEWNSMFFAVASGIAVVFAIGVIAAGAWYVAPAPLPMVAAVWQLRRRTSAVALFTEGDVLVVVNTFRTHRIPRSEISGVKVDKRFGAWAATFELKLVDHSYVHCELMEPGSSWAARPDAEQCRKDLLAWLKSE